MGYVPLGLQYASRDQKFLIYRLLISIGIRTDQEQKAFINVLLLREIDPNKMSKQQAISVIEKLNRIKADKETR
jgi:hypothetical protein